MFLPAGGTRGAGEPVGVMADKLKADCEAHWIEGKARRVAGTLNACDPWERSCVLRRADELLDERDERRATGEDPLPHDDPLAVGYQCWLWQVFLELSPEGRREWLGQGENLLRGERLVRGLDAVREVTS